MVSIVNRKHPILKRKAEVVTEADMSAAINLAENLMKVLEEDKTRQGVSANQIGEYLRVFACKINKQIVVFINPEIIWSKGSKKSNERCLTSEGCYIVKRPRICKVRWIDVNAIEHKKILLYKNARRFCHEVDHLNGLCIHDTGILWKYSKAAEELMRKEKEKKACKKC